MHTDVAAAVLAATENMLPPHSNVIANEWRLWCRLCAKEDLQGNISVFFKDEQQSGGGNARETAVCSIVSGTSSDLSLAAAIGKYFWVEIKRDEDLPKMLCTECFSLVTSLVNFSERVAKVQQMFCVLQNTDHAAEAPLDFHAIRLKYGLLDEEREHVLMQQQLPEVHYFESKPKINDLEERIFENESTTSTNPLEQPRIKIKIKKENILDELASEEEDEEDEEEYDGGDNGLNEDYDDDDDEVADENYKVEKEEVENDDGEDLKPLKISVKSKRELTKQLKKEEDAEEETTLEPPKKRRRRRRRKKSVHYVEDAYDDDNDTDVEQSAAANAELGLHENLEGPDANYTCPDCPRKFKRAQQFRQHAKLVHSKTAQFPQLPCGQCTKVFTTPSKLEAHSKVHLPPKLRKVVPCPYCDKKLSSHSLVQTHIKFIHMNERPFICEECGITVRTNAALKAHMLTHTDYAPFECCVCKKGFKNQIRLKNHMETHDPNKHICAECGLQLNSRATLNRHLLVHSDEMQHKCDYCGRAFKRAKALKNHLILHTGLKPYSCDFCDRTFANGSNCRSHKKKAHPEELAALEAAGGGKAYTRNIPKLEALKAVTKAADNLAPVVSKQSGRFAFGKKPKITKDDALESKQAKTQAAANHNKQLSSSSSLMLMSPNSVTATDSATLHSTALVDTPTSHVSPATIPNIDNIYSHIMKQATLAAHHASVIDAANVDADLSLHIKRPPSQASSCVTIEHDSGTSDMQTIQQHQQQQHHRLQQQQSINSPTSVAAAGMPTHFYTEIIKQNMQQHEQQLQLQQQQRHLHHQQQQQLAHQQQLHAANTVDDISSIRSPDSQASSHMTDDHHTNAAASVQFYNHIRQNLQGPYL